MGFPLFTAQIFKNMEQNQNREALFINRKEETNTENVLSNQPDLMISQKS